MVSLPRLDLPVDYPREVEQGFRAETYRFSLTPAQLENLRAMSRRENVALFQVLLTAYQVLLYRYSGQPEFTVGTLLVEDADPQGDGTSETVVKRALSSSFISGQSTFGDLLDQLEEAGSQVYGAWELPVAGLVSGRQQGGGSDQWPQVTFVYQKEGQALSVMQEAELTQPAAGSEISLVFSERPQQLIGCATYNAALFAKSTIARLVENFKVLLDAVLDKPDAFVTTQPLLHEREKQQLLIDWNETRAEQKSATVVELFEAQAAKTPDATALVHREQEITYSALNQSANQLAHFLLARGVGPETPVAICMHRSVEMVIGILAILKAGGAYVPLDPGFPTTRLATIFADAAPRFLLTQSELADKFGSFDIPIFFLDGQQISAARDLIENPEKQAALEDLAYVIYTSGSTGKPKGVMITHRALSHFTQAACAEYALDETDRVLQFAAISFDASVEEIFPCLTVGGTLVLRTDEMLGTATAFLTACGELGLTVVDLPTSFWHQLAGDLANSEVTFPDALRLVIIGGEKAQPGPLAEWFEHAPPSVRLVNTYGPTEATVVATAYDLSVETMPQEAHIVPIGRPLPNVTAYVLDKHLQPVPIGAAGELYLGGKGIARGYLNRPELTAERFVANPFVTEPGERLYRTGDLVRYLPDGNLVFLGRVDRQVKIRGFRIELGEIEAALGQHEAVKEVMVLATEASATGRRLVAYLTLKQAGPLTSQDLRQFLSQTLPDFMVPSVFIVLDEFPINASGKIDVPALPDPEIDRSTLNGRYTPPRSDTEKSLAAIWAQVLDVEPVGIADNFFDLGGDSIAAIRITSAANKAGLLFSPDHLFLQQTIAELAQVVTVTEHPANATAGNTKTEPVPTTPSDFPEANLSQQELDDLLAEIESL